MEYTSEKHEDLSCNQEKFRALVLRQQVTLSTQLIKPNIWLCNHLFCAALEGPFFFLFDFSKALTNAIVLYSTSISITETRNEIWLQSSTTDETDYRVITKKIAKAINNLKFNK